MRRVQGEGWGSLDKLDLGNGAQRRRPAGVLRCRTEGKDRRGEVGQAASQGQQAPCMAVSGSILSSAPPGWLSPPWREGEALKESVDHRLWAP